MRGRGFSVANLKNFRQFFLSSHVDAARKISHRRKLATQCVADFCWSHYRLLMRVEDPAAWGYYIGEAISQNWSVRALERQIVHFILNGS
jgi:hypothetical protein